MVSGSDMGEIMGHALKGAFMLAVIVIIVAVILTAVITSAIVKSSIKTPEEVKQAADKQQVIEQLTPHQKKVLGL